MKLMRERTTEFCQIRRSVPDTAQQDARRVLAEIQAERERIYKIGRENGMIRDEEINGVIQPPRPYQFLSDFTTPPIPSLPYEIIEEDCDDIYFRPGSGNGGDNLPIVFNEYRNAIDEQGIPVIDAIYYATLQTPRKDLINDNNFYTGPEPKDIIYRRRLYDRWDISDPDLMKKWGNIDFSDDGANHPELNDRLVVTGIQQFDQRIRLICVNTDKFNISQVKV